MSTVESLERLCEQMADFATEPYLLTVTEEDRPHCATVVVAWDADRLVVAAPSIWPGSEAYRLVSLLWPPGQAGGYSLIVDGLADTMVGGERRHILPIKAVLHRRGVASPSSISSCQLHRIPILRV